MTHRHPRPAAGGGRARPARRHAGPRGALPGLRAGAARPAVDRDRRPDARAPALARRAAPVALGRAGRAGRTGRRPRAGRSRWRASGDRAGEPRPRRPAVRDADAVGRDPVPHAGRGRSRAPAHPARLPLRRRGRGRVDGRRWRRGADEPRRLPAAGRLELARPPQRDRPADGVDRRARHPVPVRHRGAVLRVRPRRDQRRRADHAGALAVGAALGPPGPAPGRRRAQRAPARRCWPTSGSTPTVRWPTSSPSRARGTAAPSSPVTPRSATPTPPPAPTCCRPSAPRCTASSAAPRPRRSGRPARASTRSSTAPAP